MSAVPPLVSNTKRLLKDGETLPSGSGAHQNGSTLMSDPVPAVEEQELMSSSGLPGDEVRLNESTDEFGRVLTPGLAAASLNPPIIVPLKRLVRPVQAHQGSGVSATELTDFSPVGFQGYQASLSYYLSEDSAFVYAFAYVVSRASSAGDRSGGAVG